MRVALAHDYLTQKGGAERVALLLTQSFPEAPLYTSVYDRHQTFPEFARVDVRTSFLQRMPLAKRDPRVAFPVLPLAWSRIKAPRVDVVIASSTGWAHAMPTLPDTKLIVYCHNPARWLYQDGQYIRSRSLRALWQPVKPLYRRWDAGHAKRAFKYVVNSTVVATRVREAYGIHAEVVHPPVMIDPQAEQVPVEGLESGFWLVASRGRSYKNIQAVVEGTRGLGGQLVVVGGHPPSGEIAPHVKSLGVVTDGELRWLYANARALVSVAHEDFGLTPLEANSFGTPVAVLRAGGFLDSTDEGVSGMFIEQPSSQAVRRTLVEFPSFDSRAVRAHAQRFNIAAFQERMWHVVGDVFVA